MTIVPAAGAEASKGSIPSDVVDFTQADNGLILELEEYFGVDQRGNGLDFSDGIELGEIDRIFLWSDAFHAGKSTETPVQYVNRWKIPVTIAEEPIGIAMIGINPATVEPEMIDFIHSPGTALALDDIDEDATLVSEPETGAWFSLSEDAIVPLVRGDSGVSKKITLSQYQSMLSSRVVNNVEPTPQPDRGSVQSVVLIATTIVVLLLALLVPTILGQVRERRKRLTEVDAEAEAVAQGESDSDPVGASSEKPDGDAVVVPAEEPSAAPAAKESVTKKSVAVTPAAKKTVAKVANTTGAVKKPVPQKPVPQKPVPKKPVPKSSVSQKSVPKTAVTKSTASPTTAKKPTVARPTVARPTVAKPTVAKPTATKKPAASKPSASKSSGATEPTAE